MRRVAFAAFVMVISLALMAPAVMATHDRPFWGRSSGVTTFYDNEKDCEAFGITTKVDLPAMVSHLGLSRLITSHCPTEVGIEDGDLTLIAANGDRLVGTYDGVTTTEDGSVFYATLTITFDGGTGRFDDARGEAVMKAMAIAADGPEWPWSATWSGWLTY
jgi:hypothetical protein